MKKITRCNGRAISFKMLLVSFLFFTLVTNKVSAQVFCNNEIVYWSEDFGTGTNPSHNSNVQNLSFDGNGPLSNSGTYRVIDWTDQNSGWHKAPDHTPGDAFGKMLLINGNDKDFYRKRVNRPTGYMAGSYSVSFFILNVSVPGSCPTPLLPQITIKAEYRDANNNWVQMLNSPITTAAVPESATPTWIQMGGVFDLPTTGAFIVKRMRFTLSNETAAGCGNDFAIDDLKLATCPSGGPLPVQFLNVTAQQKGTGVAINWSTGSELNNKYFDVERSTDGGASWHVVATVQSKGNSNSTRNYTAYDAKPVGGINYYRIKQVDFDAASKYSATVTFNLKIVSTTVSVLTNPFSNNITVDFLSTRSQVVNSRLFEISGKQVLSQQLSIGKGSTRKTIDAVGNLNRGMYVLQITDENGQVLFTDKLIKQ